MTERDRLGEEGCCLICEECGECTKPCPSCVCSKCDWYNRKVTRGLKCMYLVFKQGVLQMQGVEVLKETEKAVLLHDSEYGEDWFPKSQIVTDGRKEWVSIPRWLMEEKGWIRKDDWDFLGGLTFEKYEKKNLKGKSFKPSRRDNKIRYGY